MELQDLPTTEDFTKDDWKEVLGFSHPWTTSKGYDYSAPPTMSIKARHAADVTSNARHELKLEDFQRVIALYATTDGPGSVCHDLDAVILIDAGGNDWALCEAWTDCTGWGCQDGVEWWVGTETQIRAIITPEQGRKLGEVGWS